MKIEILDDKRKISIKELRVLGAEFYQDIVVGAVDLASGVVALGGEFSHDARNALLESGIPMTNIWGFKILLDKKVVEGEEGYFSITDVRPSEGNSTSIRNGEKGVNVKVRELIQAIIEN